MTGQGPKEIFVYGTLLPGQERFRLIAQMVAGRQAARTRGRLFHLPLGYPALMEAEEGWVQGELLRFNEPIGKVLDVCDRIEGYQPDDEESSLFIRVAKQVEPEGGASKEAWCYIVGPALPEESLREGQEVDDGDWLAFRKRRSGQDETAPEP